MSYGGRYAEPLTMKLLKDPRYREAKDVLSYDELIEEITGFLSPLADDFKKSKKTKVKSSKRTYTDHAEPIAAATSSGYVPPKAKRNKKPKDSKGMSPISDSDSETTDYSSLPSSPEHHKPRKSARQAGLPPELPGLSHPP